MTTSIIYPNSLIIQNMMGFNTFGGGDYDTVDDPQNEPDDDGSYVAGSNGFVIFGYDKPAVDINRDSDVVSVKIVARAKIVNSDFILLDGTIRLNGTNYNSFDTQNLQTFYTDFSWTFSKNPSTNVSWKLKDLLGSLENVGFGVETSPGEAVRLTQCHLIVEYVPMIVKRNFNIGHYSI